ncbi:MAG: cyclic nucleotide-binding domain-containing protein [Pseudomonadota bacterium]
MTKLTALKQDIEQFGISFRQGEWESLVQRLSVLSVSRGEIIEKQVHVARQWFFIDDGIAASEQTWTHGGTTIVRFFERGDFCANMTSVWTQDIAADELFAITDVSCIVVPNEVFTDAYLNGGSFGLYLRHKVMAAHLYAKELTSAKTAGDTETRYQFLESLHPEVVARAPQKEVARFLGLTPQSLSRFLRRRKLG